MTSQRPLSVDELIRLIEDLESGDPIKDFWDERELIERLVSTIRELAHL